MQIYIDSSSEGLPVRSPGSRPLHGNGGGSFPGASPAPLPGDRGLADARIRPAPEARLGIFSDLPPARGRVASDRPRKMGNGGFVLSENQVPFTPQEAVQYLRVMRDRLPDFKLLDTRERRALARAANIGISLVTSATNVIDASAVVRNAFGREAEVLRAETESIVRWAPVLEEIDALRDGVAGGMTVRRHRLGGIALRVYQVCRQLVRYKENEELLPHIDAMKRAAGFGQRRAAETAPPKPGDPPKPPGSGSPPKP